MKAENTQLQETEWTEDRLSLLKLQLWKVNVTKITTNGSKIAPEEHKANINAGFFL